MWFLGSTSAVQCSGIAEVEEPQEIRSPAILLIPNFRCMLNAMDSAVADAACSKYGTIDTRTETANLGMFGQRLCHVRLLQLRRSCLGGRPACWHGLLVGACMREFCHVVVWHVHCLVTATRADATLYMLR